MSQRHNRVDNPAIRAAARLPTHVLASILVVLLTAVGFVAARSEPASERPTTGVGDVAETPLPTPVPLETGTPLPTPAPMPQGAVVDTAVTWWGAWLPDEVTDALDALLTEARRSRASAPTSPGDAPAAATAAATESASPTPSPSPEPTQSDQPVIQLPDATAAPLPLPVSTPLPTVAPLPDPIITPGPLPLPTPALPAVLP